MKPRIGITCAFGEATPDHYSLSSLYVDAVVAAGGLPLVLPAVTSSHFREIARCIDGLLLPGGGDVDPAYFGEEPRIENGRIDPVADAFEIGLIREFLKTGRPILGVCRGMQVLNVAAGGDLHQDIRVATGSPLQHVQQAPGWHGTHEISLSEGSLLRAVLKEERLRVNTFTTRPSGGSPPDLSLRPRRRTASLRQSKRRVTASSWECSGTPRGCSPRPRPHKGSFPPL